MSHYVYMLECVNGSFYTGYTTDVLRRYKQHQTKTARCRYTQSFPPKRLAAVWQFETRSDALAVEYQIKSLSKAEKKTLLNEFEAVGPSLADSLQDLE